MRAPPPSQSNGVQVLVRVRPPLSGNRDGASDGPTPPVDVDGEVITIRAPKRSYRAEFDRVFDRYSTQSEVFASVQDCIGSTLDGFNATLFAFGQTGSGKTHTLFGPPTTHDHFFGVTPEAGVAPRVIDSIFGEISARQRARRELHESGPGESQAATTSVYLSFLQVYNERVYDLLFEDSDADAPILCVHEDAERGIFVEGISQFAVTSKDECMLLLRTGVANRVVRETRMNEHSSRSHSVFQLLIEQKFGGGADDGGRVVRSKLNIVDLAGSERWDAHGSIGTTHIAEMTKINLSLHTLGRCITALAENSRIAIAEREQRGKAATLRRARAAAGIEGEGDGAASNANSTALVVPKAMKREHVPYRESVLTRLLQDSLGGNTKTRIIVTISPGMRDHKESISTLKFADSAKRIMSIVSINTERVVSRALVEKLEREVRHLRGALDMLVEHVPPHIAEEALATTTGGGRSSADGPNSGGSAVGGTKMMVLEQKAFAAMAENKRLRAALDRGQAKGEGGRAEKFAGSPSAAPRGGEGSGGKGGNSGGITILNAAPDSGMFYHAEDLYHELNRARSNATQIKNLARRFFDLEIEEGEMETSLASLLNASLQPLKMRRGAPPTATAKSKAAAKQKKLNAAAVDISDADLAAAEALFEEGETLGLAALQLDGGVGGSPSASQKASFAKKSRPHFIASLRKENETTPMKKRRGGGGGGSGARDSRRDPSPTPSTNSSYSNSTLGTVTLSPTLQNTTADGETPLSSPLLIGRQKWGATRHVVGLPNSHDSSITEVKKSMRRRQKTSKALNGMQVRRVARPKHEGALLAAKRSQRGGGRSKMAGQDGSWKRVEDTSEAELRAELKAARVARKQQEKMRMYLKQKLEREAAAEKKELEAAAEAQRRKEAKQRAFKARARKQKAIVEEYRRRRDQALSEEINAMDREAIVVANARKANNEDRLTKRAKKQADAERETARKKRGGASDAHHSPTIQYGSPPRNDGMGGYLERAQLEAEKFSAAADRLGDQRRPAPSAYGGGGGGGGGGEEDDYENLDFYAQHMDFLKP